MDWPSFGGAGENLRRDPGPCDERLSAQHRRYHGRGQLSLRGLGRNRRRADAASHRGVRILCRHDSLLHHPSAVPSSTCRHPAIYLIPHTSRYPRTLTHGVPPLFNAINHRLTLEHHAVAGVTGPVIQAIRLLADKFHPAEKTDLPYTSGQYPASTSNLAISTVLRFCILSSRIHDGDTSQVVPDNQRCGSPF